MFVFDTKAYRAFAEAVANLQPDWITGRIEIDQVKIALGEHLDLWPASIADDLDGGSRHFTYEAAVEALAGRGFDALRGSDGEGAIILA